MKRVIVIGQAEDGGTLSCAAFAHLLAARLGARRLDTAALPSAAGADERWVGTEPAGTFSEALFRRADTVVWLCFSPLAYVGEWIAQRGGSFDTHLRAAVAAFRHRLLAPRVRELLDHPALAHLDLIELATPGEAEYWLLAQKPRTVLRGSMVRSR
jgi:hypothetical protein